MPPQKMKIQLFEIDSEGNFTQLCFDMESLSITTLISYISLSDICSKGMSCLYPLLFTSLFQILAIGKS